jgi:hypothetical protein
MVLNVGADDAWRIVRDFGALPLWFPFVERTELREGGPHEPGAVRTNFAKDAAPVEERLLELSERDRRIAYEIIAADLPTKNYSSTLQIHEITADPASCFASWSAEFDVEGVTDA